METDFIQTIILQAPNLVGLLVAIWIMYMLITRLQTDIQERIQYLEHENQDIKTTLALIIERLNDK